MITANQMKAARALLRWSQMTMALEANLDQSTIVKFETGKGQPSVLSLMTIKQTLRAAGVEFPEHEAVRLRKVK